MVRVSNASYLLIRSRSGNPGYLLGKPILYGTLAGNYIDLEDDGLTILQPSLKTLATCPTESTIDDFLSESVKFGYDSVTSCIVSLNRSELKKFCCEGVTSCGPSNSIFSQSTGVPIYLTQVAG